MDERDSPYRYLGSLIDRRLAGVEEQEDFEAGLELLEMYLSIWAEELEAIDPEASLPRSGRLLEMGQEGLQMMRDSAQEARTATEYEALLLKAQQGWELVSETLRLAREGDEDLEAPVTLA